MGKNIEFIEFLISVEFNHDDNYLYQIIKYDKRDKNKKYILEPCYILYNKFESKIREISIHHPKIDFLERINDDGEIILKYTLDKEIVKELNLNRFIFKVVDFTPPNPGCEFCMHKQELNELFFRCDIKQRTMTKEVKKCKVFKQKRLYKT